MTTSEYFATVQYRQHEQQLIRDLERRRILAERRIEQFNQSKELHGIRAFLAGQRSHLQAVIRHQPVRG